jgi:hypothetical protein
MNYMNVLKIHKNISEIYKISFKHIKAYFRNWNRLFTIEIHWNTIKLPLKIIALQLNMP